MHFICELQVHRQLQGYFHCCMTVSVTTLNITQAAYVYHSDVVSGAHRLPATTNGHCGILQVLDGRAIVSEDLLHTTHRVTDRKLGFLCMRTAPLPDFALWCGEV